MPFSEQGSWLSLVPCDARSCNDMDLFVWTKLQIVVARSICFFLKDLPLGRCQSDIGPELPSGVESEGLSVSKTML